MKSSSSQLRAFRFRARDLPCPYSAKGCHRLFSDHSGLTRHINAAHREPQPLASQASSTADLDIQAKDYPLLPPAPVSNPPSPVWHCANLPPQSSSGHDSTSRSAEDTGDMQPAVQPPYVEYHPYINDGHFLAPGSLAPSPPTHDPESYDPFKSRIRFELADFLYRKAEMSGSKIDELMELWACTLPKGVDPPFANHQHVYATIDAIKLGSIPWQTFSVTYNGPVPDGAMPSWMVREYDVWFRDPRLVLRQQYGNPDYAGDMDYGPKRLFLGTRKRQYKDFMSGDWAWEQADLIAEDPNMHGAAFCAAILGSDKTTVSVATGQNEYYPLYLTNGSVTNSVRRAHRNAITLIGFLAIPKTTSVSAERHYQNDESFRKFRRELFHTSLRAILDPLRESMSTYEIVPCADGHYRRVVFGLGPYIADYPEQVLLACTVQGWCPRCIAKPDQLDTGEAARRSHKHTEAVRDAKDMRQLWNDYGIVLTILCMSLHQPFTAYFPRADIHELLSPDLLHQVIKGSFKDHLVTWVEEYLVLKHGKAGAAAIMADIDRRIAAVPSFPGLRRFPEGRGFKQWTGDDSKALMKVYLPAIAGHVPPQMVRAISAFLEFCYLVRRDTLDDDILDKIDDTLERFHHEREIFRTTGVRETISLPRQHSLKHYRRLICLFASPNGLCSSMMEAKHIIAVKKPYRRTSRNQALGQILLINQRLDKLAALRVYFTAHKMLDGPCPRLPRFLHHPAADSDDELEQEATSPAGESDDSETATGSAGHRRIQARHPHYRTPTAGEVSLSDPEDEDVPGREDALRMARQAGGEAAAAEENDDEDEGAVDGPSIMAECVLSQTPVRGYPKQLTLLAHAIAVPTLPDLIRHFLYGQLTPTGRPHDSNNIPIESCPRFDGNITVFPSAIATYYAPSDPSGPRGMHRERIRSVASWRGGGPRRDCIFVSRDPELPGFRGLLVARARLFFSFKFQGVLYPCVLVSWYSEVGDQPDADTGMWMVTPDVDEASQPVLDVIHLDTVVRGAHLIGAAGDDIIPHGVGPSHTLDVFRTFYVNKYADHHAHEIAF
ncbi:hypothetical protein BN946_scf184990.g2 [Trametes cinnabarina]|uniref:C2H2-type domain-containing protein n=1 Tax=Pycnoporus cinnabarinus TaxID=5643 RepID=A0A060SKF8_PYCCI|nr:hypothetical protein BN946_scf184990.g2 [Trametes cinnabarina]